MYLTDNPLYTNDIKKALSKLPALSSLTGHTVLITGATGMIGSSIIDILMEYNNILMSQSLSYKTGDSNFIDKTASGIRIIALSRNAEKARFCFAPYMQNPLFTYISHDINAPLPELGNISYILHAASNTHPVSYSTDPIGTITSNVNGTYNLLSYGIKHDCKRFFCFSSVEIYGETRGDTDKFSEGYLGYIDSNTLRAGYPESKRLSEALCNAFFKQYNLPFIIGRFSRVYGPTMDKNDSKAIAQFIKKAAAGEDIILKSDGNRLYSYTYSVDAAAAAIYLLLYGKQNEAYNISDPNSEITLKELAEFLAKESNTKVIFEIPDNTEKSGYSTATRAVLNANKLTALGFKPSTHIKEGLKKTLQIIRN